MLLYLSVYNCIKVVDVCVGVVCETSKRARERRRENDKTVASASAKENTVILTILCYTLSQVSTKRIWNFSQMVCQIVFREHNDHHHTMPYIFIRLSAKMAPQEHQAHPLWVLFQSNVLPQNTLLPQNILLPLNTLHSVGYENKGIHSSPKFLVKCDMK